ncbi:MAG TPA: hypothetical protein VFP58_07170 [Candidatus Eisenbacteria bacterium]|nr:hypothetical protein [Candidatus Eisenbacteria bacterium]
MLFRSRRKEPPPDSAIRNETARAYESVRTHWTACESCRGAAAASSSLWCARGLDLMRRGVTEDPHWETCARCREAQERVSSGQCDEGRELEQRYRVLARRLASA